MPPDCMNKFGIRCSVCIRICKWFPVVVIALVVGWSYYAYVVQLCFYTVENIIERVFYLLFYHAFFQMFIWSYWQTIFTIVGKVPKEFRLPDVEVEKLKKDQSETSQRQILEEFAKDLPVACRTINGAIRYCEKCHCIKPDRAHHCSVCGMCVLKMDHHCPWINNCVSFTNYKYFILFLGYALLYCLFIAATSIQYFLSTGSNLHANHYHIIFLFFVSAMFAASLVSLFGYHCYLVSVNRSTLESFRAPVFTTGPDKEGFTLGKLANFKEVFGQSVIKWFFPIRSSCGNGISFSLPALDDDAHGLLNQSIRWEEDESFDENDKISASRVSI